MAWFFGVPSASVCDTADLAGVDWSPEKEATDEQREARGAGGGGSYTGAVAGMARETQAWPAHSGRAVGSGGGRGAAARVEPCEPDVEAGLLPVEAPVWTEGGGGQRGGLC